MIKLFIAGDFVPRSRVAKNIEEGDFGCIKAVEPFLREADYSVVNFESPVVTHEAKPIEKTGPNLQCTEHAIECIVQAGFKCVMLANNHFRDYGQVGVEDTINACKSHDIDYVGGGKDLDEAEQTLFKTVNGQCLAIINVCENEWSIAGTDYGGSNPLNPVRNFQAIQDARKKADYVIVIVHGGVEHYQFPTPRMVDTYRFFIDAGADAVVNHHQHCYSSYEEYKGKPVFYGLGNFCFDSKNLRGDIWNEGYAVMLELESDRIGYEIIPYTQCDDIPAVELMDGAKLEKFDKRIEEIKRIISNPEDLRQEFDKLLSKIGKERLLNMEPFSNRYIRSLQRRGLFPTFIKGKVLYGWLSRLRCESHIEILTALLARKLVNNQIKNK